MKTTLTTIMLIALLASCEKESIDRTPAPVPTKVIGQWTIVPVGNLSDSFRYQIGTSLETKFTYISGTVSGSPQKIDLIENSLYNVYYIDSAFNDSNGNKFFPKWIYWLRNESIDKDATKDSIVSYFYIRISHFTKTEALNITDSLPSTVFE